MHAGGKGCNASKDAYSILKFNERGERVLLGVDVDEMKFLAPQLSLPQELACYVRMTVDTLANVLTKPTL
jgi:hypothetical protein